MRRSAFFLCFLGLLIGCAVASAQELNPEWIVGRWNGITGLGGRNQVNIRSDGTYEGDFHGLAGPIPFRDGKWAITSHTITFEHVVLSVPSSKITWTLKRNGNDLEGTGFRELEGQKYSLKLTRATDAQPDPLVGTWEGKVYFRKPTLCTVFIYTVIGSSAYGSYGYAGKWERVSMTVDRSAGGQSISFVTSFGNQLRLGLKDGKVLSGTFTPPRHANVDGFGPDGAIVLWKVEPPDRR